MAIKQDTGRPVLGVSVLVRDAGRVLLVRRGRPPLQGLWSLPGGHVEGGERLAEAAAREVREETAVEVDDLRQIDVAEIIGRGDDGGAAYHFVLVVLAGRYRSGTAVAGDDAAEARWVAPEEFGGLNMTDDTRRLVMRPAGETAPMMARLLAMAVLAFALSHAAQAATTQAAAPAPVAPAPSTAAPPPYEDQLLRLSEILGAVHYLRQLCKAEDGDVWREQMQKLLDAEQPDADQRARMIDRFNHGYDTYRSVYLSCTPAAGAATELYLQEGARITTDITARYGR